MRRPLEGRRVLVTRARRQASDLVERLADAGAIPILLPGIEVLPPASYDALDSALQRVEEFDWIVLTSANGVAAFFDRVQALRIDLERLRSRKFAVVGSATAEALQNTFRAPDAMPAKFRGDAIIAELGEIAGLRFLLARADLARPELPLGLIERGGLVEEVVAYRIAPSQESPSQAIDGPKPDVITFTSSSGVKNTCERLEGSGKLSWMAELPIVTIGPVTSGTVRELGFAVAAEADEATIPGIVRALTQWAETREAQHA